MGRISSASADQGVGSAQTRSSAAASRDSMACDSRHAAGAPKMCACGPSRRLSRAGCTFSGGCCVLEALVVWADCCRDTVRISPTSKSLVLGRFGRCLGSVAARAAHQTHRLGETAPRDIGVTGAAAVASYSRLAAGRTSLGRSAPTGGCAPERSPHRRYAHVCVEVLAWDDVWKFAAQNSATEGRRRLQGKAGGSGAAWGPGAPATSKRGHEPASKQSSGRAHPGALRMEGDWEKRWLRARRRQTHSSMGLAPAVVADRCRAHVLATAGLCAIFRCVWVWRTGGSTLLQALCVSIVFC